MKFEYHSTAEFNALEAQADTLKKGVTSTQYVSGLQKFEAPGKLIPWLQEAAGVGVDTIDGKFLVMTKKGSAEVKTQPTVHDATQKLRYELDAIQNSKDTPGVARGLSTALPDAKIALLGLEEDFVDPAKQKELEAVVNNPKANTYVFTYGNQLGAVTTDLPEKEFYTAVKRYSRSLPQSPDR